MMNSKNKAGGQVSPALRAIETEYRGYRFRSRLEARWAVFFQNLRTRWNYEEEGYVLPSGWYLPDFRLDLLHDYDRKLFLEVKRQGFPLQDDLERDCIRAQELSNAACDPVVIVAGDPQDVFDFGAYRVFKPNNVEDYCDFSMTDIDQFLNDSFYPILRGSLGYLAAKIARRVRFEHGEQG